MRRSPFILLMALTIHAGQPAVAQSGSGQRVLPPPGGPPPSTLRSPVTGVSPYTYRFARDWAGEPQSYRSALRFASCVARFDRSLVQAAALSNGTQPGGRDMLQEISRRNRGCAATPELVSATVLRAAFFETAFKNGLLGSTLTGLGIFRDQDREVAISRCQLRVAPDAVKQVLSTEPESDAEASAITQLLSQSRSCGAVVVEEGGATVWRLALLEAAARGTVAG